MDILSWTEKNEGRHGILVSPYDHREPPYELFFSSRITLYLDLLDTLPLPAPWILSLPQLDLEVTVPSIDPDCPICANTYLPNLIDEIPVEKDNPHEMPRCLPCGHHLCQECIRRLAWDADATDGLLCPFCRASHDHIPTSQGGSLEDILDKCMWVALEIFTQLHQDDFQDMDAVTRWAQDFPQLRSDVPEEDKRDAMRHAVECWLDMGDDEFSRQLAERVFRESSVEFTNPIARPVRRRRARPNRNAVPMSTKPMGSDVKARGPGNGKTQLPGAKGL